MILTQNISSPNDSHDDGSSFTRVVIVIVNTTKNRPKPVKGNRHQCEHGCEGHPVIEENPQPTEELSERPATQDGVDRVKRHRRHRNAEIRDGQIDDVDVESCSYLRFDDKSQ